MQMKNFLKNHWIKQTVTYLFLISLAVVLNRPTSLFAESYYCCEDPSREQARYHIAAFALIGLGIGVGYLVCDRGHGHCSRSSSCWSSYSSSSCSSSSSYSSSCSSSSSSCSSSSYSNSCCRYLKQVAKRSLTNPDVPSAKNSLSGEFNFVSHLSALGEGMLNVFIQLPDGTREDLGNLSFSENSGTSLAYGPFDQCGTYTFGIQFDSRTRIDSNARIGNLDINLNETSTQGYDLVVPHSSDDSKLILYSYQLL